MNEVLPVNCLAAGQRAQVCQLIGAPDTVHRLKELGLRDGTPVEMLQPGSPCIIRVDGGRLCFRDGEMLGVLVRPGVNA